MVARNLRTSTPLCAKNLMNSTAVPLKPGKFEQDLALQFLSGLYCGWPVVDSFEGLLGVVTELRLLQAVTRAHSLDDLKVEDTMTAPVYVDQNDSLDAVLNMMVQRQLLRMPVLRNRKLVGVISRGTILRHCLPIPTVPSRVVQACAWCEKVQDFSSDSALQNGWKDLKPFLSMNQLTFADISLAHTYCPACVDVIHKLNGSSQNPTALRTSDDTRRTRLLVVDDDPSVSSLLKEALQDWDYEVTLARNGREGLDIITAHRIDGILLDMHMPGMDGRTMLDELRWLGHRMPVLMMSGESDERILRQLLQEGAQGFFLKPLNLTSLKQICAQAFSMNEGKMLSPLPSLSSQTHGRAFPESTQVLGSPRESFPAEKVL